MIKILFSIPLVVPVIIALFIYFEKFTLSSDNYSIHWSILGSIFSYYGLLFSLYAAIAVNKISKKYYFKVRSPEVKKKIVTTANKMSSLSNEPPDDLNVQKIFSEIPALLRAAERFKNQDIKKVVKETKILSKKINLNCKADRVGDIEEFWSILKKLFELADEIGMQIADVKASQ